MKGPHTPLAFPSLRHPASRPGAVKAGPPQENPRRHRRERRRTNAICSFLSTDHRRKAFFIAPPPLSLGLFFFKFVFFSTLSANYFEEQVGRVGPVGPVAPLLSPAAPAVGTGLSDGRGHGGRVRRAVTVSAGRGPRGVGGGGERYQRCAGKGEDQKKGLFVPKVPKFRPQTPLARSLKGPFVP